MGSFSGSLTSPKRVRAYAGRRWILGHGWMVGANPKFLIVDRASWATSPAAPRRALPFALPLRWHWVAMAALCVPLSFVLVQCGKAPNAEMLAANTEGAKSQTVARSRRTSIDTFEDRFPHAAIRRPFPDRQ